MNTVDVRFLQIYQEDQVAKNDPSVWVIVVNYKNWRDTILCLESLFKNRYDNFRVVLVDNHSCNKSVSNIKKWARGEIDIRYPTNRRLRHLLSPQVPKPIDLVCFSAKSVDYVETGSQPVSYASLIIIETDRNLGFGGGNNLGIRLAMANKADYLWLLNNDTVIDPEALVELVKKAGKYEKSGKKVGLIGSKLLFFHEPELIQGVGGIYSPFFALSRHIGVNEKDRGQYDNEMVASQMDYVIGASMFASRDFVLDVGMMCEDYFLYFEELDWIHRGMKSGWQPGYAWKSRVYHMEGASIGTSSDPSKRSTLSDYYIFRNRLVFTKRFFPVYLPSVMAGIILSACLRIARRQPGHAVVALKALWNFLMGK